MTKAIIQNDKGFTLIELIIVVVIIGILAAVAVPVYTRHINNAKAAEAVQGLSAIITYAKSYQRAHAGQWPAQNCQTGCGTQGEWIDEVVGYTFMEEGKYFRFFYYSKSDKGPYALAEGYEAAPNNPFTEDDGLYFTFKSLLEKRIYGALKDNCRTLNLFDSHVLH